VSHPLFLKLEALEASREPYQCTLILILERSSCNHFRVPTNARTDQPEDTLHHLKLMICLGNPRGDINILTFESNPT
jgi:hypothetical protein